jgi:hypothetical protein
MRNVFTATGEIDGILYDSELDGKHEVEGYIMT